MNIRIFRNFKTILLYAPQIVDALIIKYYCIYGDKSYIKFNDLKYFGINQNIFFYIIL